MKNLSDGTDDQYNNIYLSQQLDSYRKYLVKEHTYCPSALSASLAKRHSTCLSLRTKEFLLRQFITREAQQDFLIASLGESGHRDLEEDDFYEFYFEKRSGTATLAQHKLKKQNILSRHLLASMQRTGQQTRYTHVICGAPLIGKTTFLRKTTIEIIELSQNSLQTEPLIPIYVDFFKLTSHSGQGILDKLIQIAEDKESHQDFFKCLIQATQPPKHHALLLQILKRNRLVFLADQLDHLDQLKFSFVQVLAKMATECQQHLILATRRSLVMQLSTLSNEIEIYLLQMPSEQILLRSILPTLRLDDEHQQPGESNHNEATQQIALCQLFSLCSNWHFVQVLYYLTTVRGPAGLARVYSEKPLQSKMQFIWRLLKAESKSQIKAATSMQSMHSHIRKNSDFQK